MKSLYTVEEVKKLVMEGKTMLLAGDEALLEALPKGNWIGGTIPYFMGDEGGVVSKEIIHVRELKEDNTLASIKSYNAEELANIPSDYPANGVSYIIVPTLSKAHGVFAKDIVSINGIFDSPLVGWVSGVHLDDFVAGTGTPRVYNGVTGEMFTDSAVVMHTNLPDDQFASIEIVNIFTDDENADAITFPGGSNVVGECKVNGETTTLADYLSVKKHNTQQPLIGDFMDAKLNVAIKEVNEEKKEVTLWAPVFENIDYRLSEPVDDYGAAFTEKLKTISSIETNFACNCVLNFVYGNLEGQKTGKMTGPMTWGEIGYMLLNQTMVYCTFNKK
jgi:hypothetical protein